MSSLCREFGISRKTGYKIFDRYKDHGLEALQDRSRRPFRYGNQLPEQVETRHCPVQERVAHRGAPVRSGRMSVRRLTGDVKIPAVSTIHAVLDRHDL